MQPMPIEMNFLKILILSDITLVEIEYLALWTPSPTLFKAESILTSNKLA